MLHSVLSVTAGEMLYSLQLNHTSYFFRGPNVHCNCHHTYYFLNSLWLTLVPHVACDPCSPCCLLWLINAWLPFLLNRLSCDLYGSGSHVWYGVYVIKVVLISKLLKQGCTHFPKILELCQNCGCQKGIMQQVACCRPTHTGYCHRKFTAWDFCTSVVKSPIFCCQYILLSFPIFVCVECYLMTASCNGFVPFVINEWNNMVHCWNDTDRKTEVFREKPVPVPLHPPQIARGLMDLPVQWEDSSWPPALRHT